jgi:hypothetical protein
MDQDVHGLLPMLLDNRGDGRTPPEGRGVSAGWDVRNAVIGVRSPGSASSGTSAMVPAENRTDAVGNRSRTTGSARERQAPRDRSNGSRRRAERSTVIGLGLPTYGSWTGSVGPAHRFIDRVKRRKALPDRSMVKKSRPTANRDPAGCLHAWAARSSSRAAWSRSCPWSVPWNPDRGSCRLGSRTVRIVMPAVAQQVPAIP